MYKRNLSILLRCACVHRTNPPFPSDFLISAHRSGVICRNRFHVVYPSPITDITASLVLSRSRISSNSVTNLASDVGAVMVLAVNVLGGSVDAASAFVCCVSSTLLNKGSLLSSPQSLDTEFDLVGIIIVLLLLMIVGIIIIIIIIII